MKSQMILRDAPAAIRDEGVDALILQAQFCPPPVFRERAGGRGTANRLAAPGRFGRNGVGSG
jgi:hypothetical protein